MWQSLLSEGTAPLDPALALRDGPQFVHWADRLFTSLKEPLGRVATLVLPSFPGVTGIGKLASVPAGAAVAVSAAPGSAAPAAGSAPAAGKWRLRQLLLWVRWGVGEPGLAFPEGLPHPPRPSPQQRRRRTRRRRSQRSRMMIWASACLIRVLSPQIKPFLRTSRGPPSVRQSLASVRGRYGAPRGQRAGLGCLTRKAPGVKST